MLQKIQTAQNDDHGAVQSVALYEHIAAIAKLCLCCLRAFGPEEILPWAAKAPFCAMKARLNLHTLVPPQPVEASRDGQVCMLCNQPLPERLGDRPALLDLWTTTRKGGTFLN